MGDDETSAQSAQDQWLQDPAIGVPATSFTQVAEPNQSVDPNAGQPNQSVDPNAGQPNQSVDPNAGPPNQSVDPNAGQPNQSVDPNAGQPNQSVNPNAGQPNQSVDPNADQPNQSVDPNADQPNQSVDPNAGQPNQSVDPNAGLPNQSVDPNADQPNQSVDPNAGQPNQSVNPNAGQPTASPTSSGASNGKNPYAGTPSEGAWQDGFDAGFTKPDAPDPAPAPYSPESAIIYSEGVLAGQDAAKQQKEEQQKDPAAQTDADKQAVYEASRKIFADFIAGTKHPVNVFGPDHPWTKRLQSHPHMEEVRKQIREALTGYCRVKSSPDGGEPPALLAEDDFNLNTLSTQETIAWIFKDAVSWMSWGFLGQDDAYLYGSFRLAWIIKSPSCKDGLASAFVEFHAWDVAHVGSAIRIPKTSVPLIDIGDEPLGEGLPLNDVKIFWNWREQFILSY